MTKVFYSKEEFAAYQLKTFPILPIFQKEPVPWFPAMCYDFFFDVPYLVEVTGFKKDGTHVIEERLWKLAPMVSQEEFELVNKNFKKQITFELGENGKLSEEQKQIIIQEFDEWFRKFHASSYEFHDKKSMKEFLMLVHSSPEYAKIVIESSDYNTRKKRICSKIHDRFKERKGVKIYLHYKSRWTIFYFITLLKSIMH